MHAYGIPASITLAQGILESGNGNSDLAYKSKIILVLSVIKTGLGVKYTMMTTPKMNALENTERCLIRTEITLNF